MKTFSNTTMNTKRIWTGGIILVLGILFLLDNFDIHTPEWLFSFSSLLFATGIMVGLKKNFTGNLWLLMTFTGGYFTLSEMIGFSASSYYFPFAFITLGLYLLIQQPRQQKCAIAQGPIV